MDQDRSSLLIRLGTSLHPSVFPDSHRNRLILYLLAGGGAVGSELMSVHHDFAALDTERKRIRITEHVDNWLWNPAYPYVPVHVYAHGEFCFIFLPSWHEPHGNGWYLCVYISVMHILCVHIILFMVSLSRMVRCRPEAIASERRLCYGHIVGSNPTLTACFYSILIFEVHVSIYSGSISF